MMWRGRMTLYDASLRDTTTGLLRFPPGPNPNPVPLLEGQKFVDAMIAAANRGARVINISLGNGDSTLLICRQVRPTILMFAR